MRSLLVALLGSAIALLAPACADAEDTSSGDALMVSAPDRAAIMDGLRARVKPDLANQDIVFDVSHGSLRAAHDYAWLMGVIELRGGGAPTTKGTAFEAADKDGLFDGFRIEALLERHGAQWDVVERGIGTTDVWYDGIEKRSPRAPRSIFPQLDGEPGAAVATSERMAVMNGLRSKVKPEIADQDVVFNVAPTGDMHGSYRVAQSYCWVEARIELRTGGSPTTKGTLFEEAAREGTFDGFRVGALLKKDGVAWNVVDHAVGAPDVWYAGVSARVPGVPSDILPQGQRSPELDTQR
jgi:hypothetical protein